MLRRLLAGCGVIAVGAVGLLGYGMLSADPQSPHRPGHIGCPPGSHGKPWSDGQGRKLRDALNARSAAGAGVEPPPPVADRAITAR